MLYDVSLPVAAGAAVWPGDHPYRLDWTMERRKGASVNVGALHLSVHTGTHVDAFLHFGEGLDASSMPLEKYAGPCVVVDARPHVRDGAVAASALDGLDLAGARVLLRTREAAEPFRFDEKLVWPSLALARRLADAGAHLLGTDAASVDAFDSKDLPVHRALAAGNVAILENLALAHVPPGRYELFAFPLKLVGADGSPVRAVLRTVE